MLNSIKIIFLSLGLVFAISLAVLAQEITEPAEVAEEVSEAVTEAVNLDEDIQPEDLEVGEPRLLPDSSFYFLKDWAREIQDFLTFNPVKKAELRLKFANEKLMEIKKIIEKTQNPEIIKKAIENYQQAIEEVKNRVEKIKEKAQENPKVEKFLEKFVKHQILHQNILQKLENQVPAQALEKIKEARENHLKRFEEVITKLENRKEKIDEIKKKIKEKRGEPVACAQVITYCIDPATGKCTQYPDACSTPKPCQSCSDKLSCKNLWWFDNEHNYCQQKSFCGAFMYFGLRTFETKEECEAAIQK